jgi:hypothetical protein
MSEVSPFGFKHPLSTGFRILSVQGECDSDEKDKERATGPNAIGEVIGASHDGQGWNYNVLFRESGVCVILDEHGELDDPDRYSPAYVDVQTLRDWAAEAHRIRLLEVESENSGGANLDKLVEARASFNFSQLADSLHRVAAMAAAMNQASPGPTLSGAQTATVLAALRYYQENGLADSHRRSDDLNDIVTNGGTVKALSDEQIDALCIQLNFGLPAADADADDFTPTMSM